VVVSNANAKRCESVTISQPRVQAPTALRLRKPVTSAVVVGKVGHREKIMPNDYFMEWIEWLEIVDNLPKADKIVLDRIDTELEKEEC